MPFAATWMDLEIIINKVKGGQISYITYIRNLRHNKNELIYITERESQTQKTNFQLLKQKGQGDKLGVWD